LRLTDDERRRLAVLGARRGRRILAAVATMFTPDTLLRFFAGAGSSWRGNGRTEAQAWTPGRAPDDRHLVERMVTKNPSWVCSHPRRPEDLGVAWRSTVAAILKSRASQRSA
jgi:hypothetical protein